MLIVDWGFRCQQVFPETGSDFILCDKRHSKKIKDFPGQGMPSIKYGLGIDAGGTYTDLVIIDFSTGLVVRKAKVCGRPSINRFKTKGVPIE